jgi:hypothetical protein
MYQQLWGYKVEEKLHMGVREQKRLNTTELVDCLVILHEIMCTSIPDYLDQRILSATALTMVNYRSLKLQQMNSYKLCECPSHCTLYRQLVSRGTTSCHCVGHLFPRDGAHQLHDVHVTSICKLLPQYETEYNYDIKINAAADNNMEIYSTNA